MMRPDATFWTKSLKKSIILSLSNEISEKIQRSLANAEQSQGA
jgi:hypothetical protein